MTWCQRRHRDRCNCFAGGGNCWRSPVNSLRISLRVRGKAGDAAGARDQSAALLPIRERVLGHEHPGSLTTRRDLAHWIKKGMGMRGPDK